jgi:hypothetical protein
MRALTGFAPVRSTVRRRGAGCYRTASEVDLADALRSETNAGWAPGDARFKRQIAKALGRRLAPLPKSRIIVSAA